MKIIKELRVMELELSLAIIKNKIMNKEIKKYKLGKRMRIGYKL
jgi:hypothetical protein